MKESVKRVAPGAESYTEEGCHILELSNTPEDPAVSIARARVPTGRITRWHRLSGTVERYVIIEGKGIVEVGDSVAQEVGPGDVVLIPAGCRQRIANAGEGDLIFLAVCTPRFTQQAYEDIEDAMRRIPMHDAAGGSGSDHR